MTNRENLHDEAPMIKESELLWHSQNRDAVRLRTRDSQKWTVYQPHSPMECQLLRGLRNGTRSASQDCNEAAEIFLGTNANRNSSIRLTKQLVSVRRPFPQQTNPARRPHFLQTPTNLFATSFVSIYVAASLRADPFPKSQLRTGIHFSSAASGLIGMLFPS